MSEAPQDVPRATVCLPAQSGPWPDNLANRGGGGGSLSRASFQWRQTILSWISGVMEAPPGLPKPVWISLEAGQLGSKDLANSRGQDPECGLKGQARL